MRKQLLYLLPMAVLLWGCPGGSDEEPEPEEQCLVQSESVTPATGGPVAPTWTNLYTYNSQNKVTAVARDSSGVPVSQSILSYDSNNRLVEVNSSRTKLAYEYNSKNQLVKQSRSYLSGGTFQEQDFYTFTYNNNGVLAEARYNYVGGNKPSYYYTWNYTYTNGDPTRIEQLNLNDMQLTLYEISYDDKSSVTPWPPYTFFTPTSVPSAHNPVKIKFASYGFDTQYYTIGYTYNEKGLPLTATTTYVNGLKAVTTYTYTCP